MKYIKAQKEIFNALVLGERVSGYWVDDNYYFATADGFHGYVFPKEFIAFDTNRVNEIKKLFDFEKTAVPSNELRETDTFRLIQGRMHRVFIDRKSKNVLVNAKFLEAFQNAKFYKSDNHDAIIVTEMIRDKTLFVGVVLPIRISEV